MIFALLQNQKSSRLNIKCDPRLEPGPGKILLMMNNTGPTDEIYRQDCGLKYCISVNFVMLVTAPWLYRRIFLFLEIPTEELKVKGH